MAMEEKKIGTMQTDAGISLTGLEISENPRVVRWNGRKHPQQGVEAVPPAGEDRRQLLNRILAHGRRVLLAAEEDAAPYVKLVD
jgi:hypothetical protein